MGFKKPTNSHGIQSELYKLYGEIKSPYNDGYTSWGLKQELYEIKFLIDKLIKDSPTFTPEEEWLEEQHKKHVWSELKR